MIGGGIKIVAIKAAPSRRHSDDLRLFFQRQAAAILHMIGVDDIGQGLASAAFSKADGKVPLDIGGRDQLALAQGGKRFRLGPRLDSKATPSQCRPSCGSSASTRPGSASVPR